MQGTRRFARVVTELHFVRVGPKVLNDGADLSPQQASLGYIFEQSKYGKHLDFQELRIGLS